MFIILLRCLFGQGVWSSAVGECTTLLSVEVKVAARLIFLFVPFFILFFLFKCNHVTGGSGG